MSANYVARVLNYQMIAGWREGDQATNDHFCPIETFGLHFEQILMDVRAMGFTMLDIWQAHLNWGWATAEHIAVARELLARHRFQVASLAGDFGTTPTEFERSCQLAHALGIRLLGGSTPLADQNRPFVVETLTKYDLILGLENQAEKTPTDLLAKIDGGGNGRIGTTVDTGWYGSHGYNAAQAIRQLGSAVVHVHLKDVVAVGSRQTCRFGRGIVPLKDCVQALYEIGYGGIYTVEHEPHNYNPTEECTASRVRLNEWLSRFNAPSQMKTRFPALTRRMEIDEPQPA
jgi:sugar phosphate isomerase/epimerase